MKRLLLIDEKDFEILSRFASTGRTFDNAVGRLEDIDHDPDGRIQIAIDELKILHRVVENLNNEAKKLRFCEEGLKQSNIYKEEYLKLYNQWIEICNTTINKISEK